jgi:hypothetical protein
MSDFSAFPPCSRALHEPSVQALATRLTERLGLAREPRIEALGAQDAWVLERGLRLELWAGRGEPMRESMHAAAQGMLARVEEHGMERTLGHAWKRAWQVAEGPEWRAALTVATSTAPSPQRACMRHFFRAAQQAFTRAARWNSVMPDGGDELFTSCCELIAFGVWPLGVEAGVLRLAVPSDLPDAFDRRDGARGPAVNRDSRSIVLCATFAASNLAGKVQAALAHSGWEVRFGPRIERGPPIERLIARDMEAAFAVVAVSESLDSDFGAAWWLRQEVEYALALGRPVICVGESEPAQIREEFRPCEVRAIRPADLPGWLRSISESKIEV